MNPVCRHGGRPWFVAALLAEAFWLAFLAWMACRP
jgi:hypothetical protein